MYSELWIRYRLNPQQQTGPRFIRCTFSTPCKKAFEIEEHLKCVTFAVCEKSQNTTKLKDCFSYWLGFSWFSISWKLQNLFFISCSAWLHHPLLFSSSLLFSPFQAFLWKLTCRGRNFEALRNAWGEEKWEKGGKTADGEKVRKRLNVSVTIKWILCKLLKSPRKWNVN